VPFLRRGAALPLVRFGRAPTAVAFPFRSVPARGAHRGVSCHVERTLSPLAGIIWPLAGIIWIRLRPWT